MGQLREMMVDAIRRGCLLRHEEEFLNWADMLVDSAAELLRLYALACDARDRHERLLRKGKCRQLDTRI